MFNALLVLALLLLSTVLEIEDKLTSSVAIATLIVPEFKLPCPTLTLVSFTFKLALKEPPFETCKGVNLVGDDTLSTPLTTVLCLLTGVPDTISS